MRKIHTVLRLHFQAGLSRREIAKSQSISYGTVANYLRRAELAELTWPLPSDIGERELGAALFPERDTSGTQKRFAEPDFARFHLELKSVGMTKQLAWEEYRPIHPDDGYSYSQFCHRYLVWLQRGEDIAILQKRQAFYEQQRSENPQRWKNKTRDWSYTETVTLNPVNKVKAVS